MKRLFFALLAIMALSCSKFDDSEIWDKLNNHESRITELEKLCKEMNAEIIKLQTLVTALENNDYIVTASPLVTGDGYTFVFKSGKSVVVYNGKDGTNGTTPQIGVKQDTDGFYYWTVNGEWLIVDGHKVRASATDGVNGENGTDGITPKFKIEDDYWYVSYDNGQSWEMLGRATGNNGLNGEDGDTLFNRVYIEDGYVCFELNTSDCQVIRIPLLKDGNLDITIETEGTLANLLTQEEIRTTTSMTLHGKFNTEDLKLIQIMNNLSVLNLTDAEFSGSTLEINPYQDALTNRSIMEVRLPKRSSHPVDLSYCIALTKVVVNNDDTTLGDNTVFCDNLNEVEYAEGVTISGSSKWENMGDIKKVIYPSTLKTISPTLAFYSSVTYTTYSTGIYVHYDYTYWMLRTEYVCKALTPPEATGYVYDTSKDHYYLPSSNYPKHYNLDIPAGSVVYVPAESVDLYRAAPLWENFTNILPLESLEE